VQQNKLFIHGWGLKKMLFSKGEKHKKSMEKQELVQHVRRCFVATAAAESVKQGDRLKPYVNARWKKLI
jgi:hypothetical protein